MSINCVNPLLNKHFTIGEWQVEPLSGCFKQSDKSVHVEPKVMDVLLCLADKPGGIISRDELLSRVWNGVGVSDEVLTRAISELRTLLGDTDREKRYIRTIPKRGYSLITEVICIESGKEIQGTDTSAGVIYIVQDGSETEVNGKSALENPSSLNGTDNYNSQSNSMSGSVHQNDKDPKTLSSIFISFMSNIIGKAVISTLLIVFGLLISPKLISLFHANKSKTVSADSTHSLSNNNISFENSSSENNTVTEDKNPELINTDENTHQTNYEIPDWITSNKVKTIAVLPMVNLSVDSHYAFFADGLSEDIRNALIGMSGIKVVARTSSRVFKDKALDVREIGKQLNADALIEGTIRVRNGRVRVTTQLTNAHNGYPFWASSFDKDMSDVFAIQYEIAQEVAAKLKLELQPVSKSSKPVNPIAYEKYLWGRSHWHQRTKSSMQTAIQYFSEAIKEDPNFALAYSGLADAYSLSISYAEMPIEEAVPKAREYAQKALSLDKNLAEVHASIGTVYMIEHKLTEARQAYEKAIELKPTYSMARMWLGNILLGQKEVALGYEQYRVALDNDPLHPQVQSNYLSAMLMMGRCDDAISLAKQYYKLSHDENILKILLSAYTYSGRYDKQLEFLLQHKFTDKHLQKNNTKQFIIALAYLDRLDEAMLMFKNKRELFDPWQRTSLALSLAVARNDSTAVFELANELDAGPGPVKWEPKTECPSGKPATKAVGMYWRGISRYMENDYVTADNYFNKALELTKIDCWPDFEMETKTMLYRADIAVTMKNSAVATTLLGEIYQTITDYEQTGWKMMTLKIEKLAYHLLSENRHEVEKIIVELKTDTHEPWGVISDEPFFRKHLKDKRIAELFKPFQISFVRQQQASRQQDLAKFD